MLEVVTSIVSDRRQLSMVILVLEFLCSPVVVVVKVPVVEVLVVAQ